MGVGVGKGQDAMSEYAARPRLSDLTRTQITWEESKTPDSDSVGLGVGAESLQF